MSDFYKETENIYRLEVPFYSVYTSVFLVRLTEGYALLDIATTDSDVDDCIIPALERLGVRLCEIGTIVISHGHGDHSGGLKRLLDHSPNIEIVRDVRALCESVVTYKMSGHTTDCIGLFDKRDGTLISADGLQGAGIGKYRCSLADSVAYRETLDRIREDERVDRILFSHAYEPWYKNKMEGREEILSALTECEKYIK